MSHTETLGIFFMGRPLEELSREELIKVILHQKRLVDGTRDAADKLAELVRLRLPHEYD